MANREDSTAVAKSPYQAPTMRSVPPEEMLAKLVGELGTTEAIRVLMRAIEAREKKV